MKFIFKITYIFLLLYTVTMHASECYHYHTPTFYKLFTDNNQLVFQHTVKDPNQISYVSQESVVIPNINTTNFTILAEDNYVILFSTSDGYFLLEKSMNEVKEYGINKLGSQDNIQESLGTRLVCSNGKWNYIKTQSYSNKTVEIKLENVPENLQLIAESKREYMLFKNDKHVYVFSPEDYTFKMLPQLDPSSTQFIKIKDRYTYIDVLIDNNTVSTVDAYFDFTDLSPELSKLGAFKSFKNATLLQNGNNIVIDTNDGYLWCYVPNGKYFEDIGKVNFVPLKAKYLNNYNQLISFGGSVFMNGYDAVFKNRAIDISLIKNIKEFRKTSVFYTDDIQNYWYDYDNNIFQPFKTIPAKAQFFPAIETYNYLGTYNVYADKNEIYLLDYNDKIGKTLQHKSPIKDLQIALAYDDKLLIENKEIENIAKLEDLTFLGSTVDIIFGCDGGSGEYPVVIDVYYFFKDKAHIYVCNTKDLKMRIINNIDNEAYSADDFKQLEYLMNLEKTD